MEVRPRHLIAAFAAHIAVAVLLWLTQVFHPIPQTLEVMEVVFVEPIPAPVQPTPVAPQPTPAPTPPPATPPPVTPPPTPPPPDPAVELKKFTDAIALKMDCGNLDAMRAQAARGATPEQRAAAGRLIQQKVADCNREAEEKVKEEERKRVEEAERKRLEEERRQREELQRQIEQERRERELAEQMARQAALAAQLQAEQDAINRGIVNRAGSVWAGQVAAAIRPNMTLPPDTRSDMVVSMFFRVLPDGTIVEMTTRRGSGSSAFDLAMERAVERTGKLPPITEPLLAEEIRRNGITLNLTPPR